ncbi:hypothetical protein PPERSA_02075 [Pseudocohnilembus persalinus]|uniref:Peptidase C51 domain-containing protein n=1 Tax=Pseudocohnilembus persalinus TaxID=266149 RepID=A0A0V0Q803_PSEPJ|nr:hypothetical protein PPERSA_02075 [Pseudocohnilembus persalinus]|eukprot:KRW98298.1 hypothetical protein PPERSA_02075 [Pseudocohnilembus persalinus]
MNKSTLALLLSLLAISTIGVYQYQSNVDSTLDNYEFTEEEQYLLTWASGQQVSNEITKIAGPSSKGQCAKYVREAIQRANGAPVQPTGIVSAKDYGPFVKQYGYKTTSRSHEQAVTGDVAILAGQPAHPHGHIAIKCSDGKWRSDFVQNSFWIYKDGSRPSYTIYTL